MPYKYKIFQHESKVFPSMTEENVDSQGQKFFKLNDLCPAIQVN